jgi:hypothetical protein
VSVYFISAREMDLVKIGYAFDPVRRFNHLRTFSPAKLTLEGAIPGGRDKERELHKRFALARVHGEWFKLTPGLQAEIDASTRPEKFTWASVRKWRDQLIKAEEVHERKAVPPAVIAETDELIQEALNASAHRKHMAQLERLEAAGAIHFPFRAKEPA